MSGLNPLIHTHIAFVHMRDPLSATMAMLTPHVFLMPINDDIARQVFAGGGNEHLATAFIDRGVLRTLLNLRTQQHLEGFEAFQAIVDMAAQHSRARLGTAQI
jgi:hypothetical protein